MIGRRLFILPILLWLLHFPSDAEARLGDTEQEAISRYGLPTRQEQAAGFDRKLSFDAQPYSISVLLKGGRVVAISYQQADKQKISLSRVERLLRYNGERENEPEGMDLKNIWFLDGGAPGSVRFLDKAGKAEAVYDQTTNTLTVRSRQAQASAPTHDPAPKAKPALAGTAKPAAAAAKAPAKQNPQTGRQAAKPAAPPPKRP